MSEKRGFPRVALVAAGAGLVVLLAVAAPPRAGQGTIIPGHKVTSVVASFANSQAAGQDAVQAEFSARIACTAKGTVRYRWLRSDGAKSGQEEIAFTAAGIQSVTTSWKLGAAHAGLDVWMQVEVIFPNSLKSNQAKFLVPATGFKVTGVLNSVSPTSWIGPCPKEFQVTSQIAVAGQGTVKYRWVRSDGGTSQPVDLPFSGPGTKTVATSWKMENKNTGQGVRRWITVEVLYPNHILPPVSNALATGPVPDAAEFDLACSGYTSNPNAPMSISLSASGIGIQANYICPVRDPKLPPEKWLLGSLTVKNLSSNPINVDQARPYPDLPHSRILVLQPLNAQSLSVAPQWPFPDVINDGNWIVGLELPLPALISPNGQYSVQVGTCCRVFADRPTFYFGAILRDTATGRTVVSNLVKWEGRI